MPKLTTKTNPQTFLPTVELVLYETRGEFKISLTFFDATGRGVTTEGDYVGASRREAVRKVSMIASRIGLVRCRDNSNIWRKLVPSEEF